MKKVPVGDEYRFEGLSTNKTEMSVLWSLNGKACPPVHIIIEDCTPLLGLPALQLEAPPELSASCPGLVAVLKGLSGVLPTEHLGGFFDVPVLVTVALGAMWVVFAALLIVGCAGCAGCARRLFYGPLPLVARRCRRKNLTRAQRGPSRQRTESSALTLSLLALFCFSLLLNWSLSSGGPGDLRLNLAGIWSPELELRWGPAPTALFRGLGFVLGDLRDTDIVWCNLILSSILPLLLYGIVADLGTGEIPALLAAFVVAAHPLLIAFSGVLERQATCRFAAFGSILALISFLKRGKASQLIAFVLGAILAAASRPEGAQVLVVAAAIVMLVPSRRRAAAAVALALLVPLAFAYVHTLEAKFPGAGKSLTSRAPLLWTVLFDRDFTPLAWIAAWTLGLVLGIRRRAAWVALLSLLGLDIIWRWTGVYHMFVGHARHVAATRYESILLVPFTIGIALFIQAFIGARRWVKVVLIATFLACTAITCRRPLDTLVRPFTIDYEYRFLKKYALTLAPDARLYILDSPTDDTGLIDAHLIGRFVGSNVDFVPWSARRCDEFIHDSSPTYLYIGSSCSELVDAPQRQLPVSYAGWMRDCSAIRERVSGDPVEVIDVPAHKMSWHDFKDSTVRLALYRLKDPSICNLGPNYPWRPE